MQKLKPDKPVLLIYKYWFLFLFLIKLTPRIYKQANKNILLQMYRHTRSAWTGSRKLRAASPTPTWNRATKRSPSSNWSSSTKYTTRPCSSPSTWCGKIVTFVTSSFTYVPGCAMKQVLPPIFRRSYLQKKMLFFKSNNNHCGR